MTGIPTVSYTLAELAATVGGRIEGSPEVRIDGVATLADAQAQQITFLTNSRYRKQLTGSRAGAVILREEELVHCPTPAVVVANPHVAFAKITALFAPKPDAAGIHPSATVHATAQVHESASIGAQVVIGPGAVVEEGVVVGPGCVLERGCRIGAGSRLYGNVTVYHECLVGKRAIIHSGTVIGSDGFGFANDQGTWIKVHQLGRVRVGDDVEIGANCCIDRGAIEDTVIEDGVKLDNLVHVAHNVRIGAHSALAGCVGIAGSTTIGKHCAIGGMAAISGHVEVADHVTLTGTTMVSGSIKEPGVYSSGTAADTHERWQKNAVRFRQLDDMARRLKKLEKELETLKKG